ncbi:MAG: hypothetical protein H6712_24550 [Myxococcales bacterium]|nr:hypothetical protein [Myxococcales bacterium]MCB9717050.1 hypothetical protein [Myxococcales bacterium]
MGDALFDDDQPLLPADWDLPSAIRARLGHTVGRQRVIAEAGHLLVILHRVPAAEEHERRACIAWRDPSGRWRTTSGVEGLLGLRQTIDEYRTTLVALDERIESAPAIDGYFEILEQLAPISRAARHMHATLQKARETSRNERVLVDLRDQAYAVERRADLLSGDARFAVERAMARSSHQQSLASQAAAAATDRLNRLAAVFLPIGTVAALLGMNIPSGLEPLPPPWPFVLIVVVGLLAGWRLSARIHRGT